MMSALFDLNTDIIIIKLKQIDQIVETLCWTQTKILSLQKTKTKWDL